MDAISADAPSARGVVLDQEGYIAGERQITQPEVQSGVGLGTILAKQDASHICKLDDFGQRSFDRERSVGRKRAVWSVSVSNHAGRGTVNVAQAATHRINGGGKGRSNCLLTIGATFTTLSHGRPVEGAKAATPSWAARPPR
jgi:hypothetical protein